MHISNLFAEKAPDYASDERLLPSPVLDQEDQDHDSETALPNSSHSPRRRRRSRLPANFFFHTSLALLNLTAGLLIGYWCRTVGGPPSAASFGINTLTPIPKRVFTERHDVAFVPDARYIGPGHDVNKNWAKLTEGGDSIYIDDPSAYALTDPGIAAPFFTFTPPPARAAALPNARNFYVLNNMHQLHCVNMIRKRYNALVYPTTPKVDPLSGAPVDDDWLTHLEHCFEYLRLSVTCADYMVLESDSPPSTPEELTRDNLAWGVVHSCVDWEGLMAWQREQVGVYNATWN